MTEPAGSSIEAFEHALDAARVAHYELTLFVSGATDRSARAISNVVQLCADHLAGRYELSVVDVNDDESALLESRILAAPTLVKSRPLPVRHLVGDLSDTDRVLVALDLPVPARPRPAAG